MAADLLDLGIDLTSKTVAARTNALAVTRDYISQPRISELLASDGPKHESNLSTSLFCFAAPSVQNCIGSERTLGHS